MDDQEDSEHGEMSHISWQQETPPQAPSRTPHARAIDTGDSRQRLDSGDDGDDGDDGTVHVLPPLNVAASGACAWARTIDRERG